MSFSRTLAQLKTSVQVRGQLENSADITGSVLTEIINDALIETHDLVVEKWADYHTTSSTFALTPGVDTYSCDTFSTAHDFYKLRKLELAVGTRWMRLLPHDLDASHLYVGNGSTSKRYRYRIQDGSIVLVPTPSAVDTVRMYYVRAAPQLTADSDSVTFKVAAEQKLVLAIAWRDVLDRQELDPSPATQKMGQLLQTFRVAADGVDATEPFYIDPTGPASSDLDEEWWY